MKIQLKNIQHAQFASEETNCYDASLYFQGKKVGSVGNDGHGGCDREHRSDKALWADMEAFIGTLPPREGKIGDKTYSRKQTLESICNDLLTEHLLTKDLKRLLKNRVVYVQDGSLYQTKCAKDVIHTLAGWIEQIKGRHGVSTVLNELDFSKALEIFTQKTQH
ncbi:MAG: hypothetical protein V3U84_02185 [Thiotrichaceae bacterium]